MSSNSTNHTSRNLCCIVEQWLVDQHYPLYVAHEDHYGREFCSIYGNDMGMNPITIGFIESTSVLFIGDDAYDVHRLHAHDVKFFDQLTELLNAIRR